MRRKHFRISVVPFCILLCFTAMVLSCASKAERVSVNLEADSAADGSVTQKKTDTVKESSTPEEPSAPASAAAETPAAEPAVKSEKKSEEAPAEIGSRESGPESSPSDLFESSGGGSADLAMKEKAAPAPEPSAAREGMPKKSSAGASSARPSASGLKAGFADDNKQYGYFVHFLEEYKNTPHIPLPVQERIIIKVEDKNGKPIPNAEIAVSADGQTERGKTLADGTFLFFPSEYPDSISTYPVTVTVLQETKRITLQRSGERSRTVMFDRERYIPEPIPLDILFVFDTTGSMGEEIQRLKTTIELIHMNLSNLSIKPEVRFGMVLYKDIGDEYRTQVVPLTADLEQFQETLDLVEASGGGDTPEDLQAALEDSVRKIEWNSGGIRLGFIITDAPPHLDYGQKFNYTDAAKAAKAGGIKFFSIGTGGLNITGEYILRQISQYTSGKYIFLTYGESGESEGGSAGSVSHHTGTNFQTDKLEAIIIRFAKEELSQVSDLPVESADSYFVARKINDEQREETLNKLFSMAVEQLLDYSTIAVEANTPAAVLPLAAQKEDAAADAEYFTERLVQQVSSNSSFTIVERKDLQKIIEELKLQMSGLTDNSQAAEVGKLLNADIIITGTLYKGNTNYELFLKMVRVESGEILSVTKAKIDPELGLTGI